MLVLVNCYIFPSVLQLALVYFSVSFEGFPSVPGCGFSFGYPEASGSYQQFYALSKSKKES